MRNLLILLFSCIQLSIFAQNTDCEKALVNSYKLYDKGLYEEVINTLEETLKECSHTSDDKRRIFELLTGAYYALDNLEKADTYVRKFLRKAPNYKANVELDTYEFIQTFQKYEVTPRLVLSFLLNYSRYDYDRRKIYSVWDGANYTGDYIKENKFGLFSFSLDWYFSKSFWFTFGVYNIPLYYERKIVLKNNTNRFIHFKESTDGTATSFLINYRIPVSRQLYPSIYVGLAPAVFANPIGMFRTPDYGNTESVTGEVTGELKDVDLSAMRNTVNLAFNTGVRLHYKYDNFIFLASFSIQSFYIHTQMEKPI